MNILQRTIRLMLPDERRQAIRVAGAVWLTALLNFAGIASLLPVLYLLLERHSNHSTVLLFCLVALVVVVLKAVCSTWLLRVQHDFLLSLYKRLTLALYRAYYRRGLLFIHERGAGRLVFEVNSVCFAFTQSILMPLLRMAADAMLLTLVTIAFLFYDAYTMLLLYASFIPFVTAYLLIVRKRIAEYGHNEQQARREQSRIAGDTFRGYAESEVYGHFDRQCHLFAEGADEVARNRRQMLDMQRIPMLLSELSIVIGLSLLTFTNEGDISLLIGAFAIVALRLLPALRNLLTGWTQIQHAAYGLDIIEEGLAGETSASPSPTAATSPLAFHKDIRLEGLTFAYPTAEPVIRGLDACIHKGEMVGISGHSGVGKTTLFNLLLGFLPPTAGSITIDGVPLDTTNRAAWLAHIGYVSQDVFVFDCTLGENIALGEKQADAERIHEVLRQVALDEWVTTLPQGLDTPMNECGTRLSGGQKQRLGLARALYKRADILLLDEATSALDPHTEEEINHTLQALRRHDKELTIIYIAHHESAWKLCDRVIDMKENNLHQS